MDQAKALVISYIKKRGHNLCHLRVFINTCIKMKRNYNIKYLGSSKSMKLYYQHKVLFWCQSYIFTLTMCEYRLLN